MNDRPDDHVTRAEFSELHNRHTALVGIVKALVQANYTGTPINWEHWLDQLHRQAETADGPDNAARFSAITSILEMMITTPRDPELKR